FPGLQQRVMGNLDTVLSEYEQALGAEDIDDRVDVADLRSRRVQIGLAAPPPLELAIRGDDGELNEDQTCRVFLSDGQGVVGGLGAAVGCVGDAARASVGAQ